MKMRLKLILTLIIGGIFSVYAQNKVSTNKIGSSVNLQILHNRIEQRDSVMTHLKKNALVDSLYAQNKDYKEALEITTSLYKRLFLMTTPDTCVFKWSIPEDMKIPDCLSAHIGLIRKIQNVEALIDSTEQKIKEIDKKLSGLISVNKEETIKKEITPQVKSIEKQLIVLLDSVNLSTLSEDQKKYLDPGLIERYNNFVDTYYK
jgi:hypothetical protein